MTIQKYQHQIKQNLCLESSLEHDKARLMLIMNSIPREIWLTIVSELHTRKDLINFGLVNRSCYILSIDAPGWNLFLGSYFPHYKKNINKSFKQSFRELKGIESNIKNNRYYSYILDRDNYAFGKINLISTSDHGKYLITTFKDKTIQVCDIENKKILQTFDCGYDLEEIQCTGERVIGRFKGEFKIWDVPSGKLIFEIHNNEDTAQICLWEEKLVVPIGENDGYTIQLFDLQNGKLWKKLQIHDGRCYRIHIHGEHILISHSHSVKIWDPGTEKILRTISDPNYRNYSHINVIKDRVFVISDHSEVRNSAINIFNYDTGEKLRTIVVGADTKDICSLAIYKEEILIVGCRDPNGTIHFFNLKENKGIKKIHLGSPISDLLLYGDQLLINDAREMKVWNLEDQFILHSYSKKIVWNENGFSWVGVGRCGYFDYQQGKFFLKNDPLGVEIKDFNAPSRAPYSLFVLKENLNVLKQMADAEAHFLRDTVQQLAATIHPDFRQRLSQHFYKLYSFYHRLTPQASEREISTLSLEIISRVQIEVCIEVLLQDSKDRLPIFHKLCQLTLKDQYVNQIFWKILGKNLLYQSWLSSLRLPRSSNVQFQIKSNPLALENQVLEFKNCLKEYWGNDLCLLLENLGIVLEEEYQHRLSCSSRDLAERGILSPNDLQIIFDSPFFQCIQPCEQLTKSKKRKRSSLENTTSSQSHTIHNNEKLDRLRSYLHQPLAIQKWKILHANAIHDLSTLIKLYPSINFFHLEHSQYILHLSSG